MICLLILLIIIDYSFFICFDFLNVTVAIAIVTCLSSLTTSTIPSIRATILTNRANVFMFVITRKRTWFWVWRVIQTRIYTCVSGICIWITSSPILYGCIQQHQCTCLCDWIALRPNWFIILKVPNSCEYWTSPIMNWGSICKGYITKIADIIFRWIANIFIKDWIHTFVNKWLPVLL